MIRATSACLLLLCGSSAFTQTPKVEQANWPFFAFDNGVGRGTGMTPDQQAALLAELGYQGIGYTGVQQIPAMLRALESRGLKMYSTYLRVDLDAAEQPYEPGLPQAIEQLKGHGTALWLHVHGTKSPNVDLEQRAIEVIGNIADMAKAADLPVVLYPHTGFYVATTQDAVRLAKKIDRDNVGASFNLCHFLKQNDPQQLEPTIRQALPVLKLVSINGADTGDTRQMNWDRLIQTLDRGTLDLLPLLQLLARNGYRGPIGLQCYAIEGDARDNLTRSMASWRRLITQL